jgi:hypothetical protein
MTRHAKETPAQGTGGESHRPRMANPTGSACLCRLRLLRRCALRNDRVRPRAGDPAGVRKSPAYPVFLHSIAPFARACRSGAEGGNRAKRTQFRPGRRLTQEIVQNEAKLGGTGVCGQR